MATDVTGTGVAGVTLFGMTAGAEASSTDSFLIMVDDPRERMYFLPPEISGDSISAEYETRTAQGLTSHVLRYWKNTGVRTLGMTVTFVMVANAKIEVFDPVNWLKSLQYPISSKEPNKKPPLMLLNIGQWIQTRVVIKSVSTEWAREFDIDTHYPIWAKVTLDMEQAIPKEIGLITQGIVRRGGVA